MTANDAVRKSERRSQRDNAMYSFCAGINLTTVWTWTWTEEKAVVHILCVLLFM